MEHSPRIPDCSWRYLRSHLALLAAPIILVSVLGGMMHGQAKPPVNSPVKAPVKPPATSASKCVTVARRIAVTWTLSSGSVQRGVHRMVRGEDEFQSLLRSRMLRPHHSRQRQRPDPVHDRAATR